MPELGAALADGATTGDRVDVLANATVGLQPDELVRLYLGRQTRLANRAQRRALRVLYRTCALCDVPFEHTQIHHVTTYTVQHGSTDIDNLLPICTRHHHLAHEGRWKLHLATDRTLTTTKPDGTTTIHAPPRARAA